MYYKYQVLADLSSKKYINRANIVKMDIIRINSLSL